LLPPVPEEGMMSQLMSADELDWMTPVPSTALVLVDGTERGSGFLVDRERRLVLTTSNVVRQATTVEVVFPAYAKGELITDRAYYLKHRRALARRGTVLRRDPSRDLALIQLEAQPRGVPALPLAAGSPRVGDRLYRLGTPAASGPAWKLIAGEASWVGAGEMEVRYSDGNRTIKARMIQTDCGGRHGDGGCPLVNVRGELVGVHFAGTGSGSDAIAVEEVHSFLEEV